MDLAIHTNVHLNEQGNNAVFNLAHNSGDAYALNIGIGGYSGVSLFMTKRQLDALKFAIQDYFNGGHDTVNPAR